MLIDRGALIPILRVVDTSCYCWFPSLFAAYSKPLCTMLGSVGPEGIMEICPIHVTGTVGISFVKKAFQPGQWSLSSCNIFVGGERHNCHAMFI